MLRNKTHFIANFLLVLLLMLLSVSCRLQGKNIGDSSSSELAASSKEASWEDQLTYMVSLLYLTSNINVINGLNLDAGQIDSLSSIAASVEKEIPRYSLKGSLSPELEKVAGVYLELKDKLLGEEQISAEMMKRVVEARAIESKVLREGLTYDSAGKYGDCLRCHRAPGEKKSGVDINQARTKNPGIKKEQGYAHIMAPLGTKGLAIIWREAKKVDAILNVNQKEMLKDFSCCLVPPQGISNPIRIGQVEASVYEVQLLEEIRKIPGPSWEEKKQLILKKLESLQYLKYPDISKSELEKYRRTVAAVMDKARDLKPEDFELRKEELAAEMKQMKTVELNEKLKLFQAAFFLVMPGSKEAYEAARARQM